MKRKLLDRFIVDMPAGFLQILDGISEVSSFGLLHPEYRYRWMARHYDKLYGDIIAKGVFVDMDGIFHDSLSEIDDVTEDDMTIPVVVFSDLLNDPIIINPVDETERLVPRHETNQDCC